jgi:hypothetical protein
LNMNRYVYCLLVILMSGCSMQGMRTAAEYDTNTNRDFIIKFEGKRFQVQDVISKSSAFVSEGMSAQLLKAMLHGGTFFLVDATAPVEKFEGAMQNYLNEYKDSECEIIRSDLLSDNTGGGLGYEMFYKCK